MIEKIASATEGVVLRLLTQIRLKVGDAEETHLNSIVCNDYIDSGKAFQSTN
jgi:hypothetical protein